MTVKEITIKIFNKSGQLAEVSELMREAGVNILALFVFSNDATGTTSFVRFVSDNPNKAINVLISEGFKIELNEIVAAEVPYHSGGLLAILTSLKRADINLEYLYPCMQKKRGDTILLLGIGTQLEEAVEALKKDWIHLYGEELYNM